jgi:prepilin-type N-terminal cleavage/methylation domain-containing protein
MMHPHYTFLIRKKASFAFTLIEVMMATAIMAIAFSAILTTQSNSILLTIKTRDTNLAGFLARNLMVESEHLMEGKPFGELKQEELGTYPAPYERFKWKREVKEIEFPDFASFAAGGDSGDDQGNNSQQARILGQSITRYLSNAVREMVITVSWPRGDGEQSVRLSTYLINLNERFSLSL